MKSQNESQQIEIAVMTLIWGNLSVDDLPGCFLEAAQAGYDGVTVFAEEVLDPYLDSPDRVSDLLDGLKLAAVDCRLGGDRGRYERYLDLMQGLGSRIFVCIDPAGQYPGPDELARDLNQIGALARERGITAYYHNHTNAVGESFTDMQRLLEKTDPALVSVMLDVGHATKDFREFPHEERALTFLDSYWERIDYLELKDWNEETDLNTPLGEGRADYDRIFALLKDRAYTGWLTVEQNGNDGRSLGRTPYECAAHSREFIRRRLGV